MTCPRSFSREEEEPVLGAGASVLTQFCHDETARLPGRGSPHQRGGSEKALENVTP